MSHDLLNKQISEAKTKYEHDLNKLFNAFGELEFAFERMEHSSRIPGRLFKSTREVLQAELGLVSQKSHPMFQRLTLENHARYPYTWDDASTVDSSDDGSDVSGVRFPFTWDEDPQQVDDEFDLFDVNESNVDLVGDDDDGDNQIGDKDGKDKMFANIYDTQEGLNEFSWDQESSVDSGTPRPGPSTYPFTWDRQVSDVSSIPLRKVSEAREEQAEVQSARSKESKSSSELSEHQPNLSQATSDSSDGDSSEGDCSESSSVLSDDTLVRNESAESL